MTQEEAKHFSEYVSGRENKDGQTESKLKKDVKSMLHFGLGRPHRRKFADTKEEAEEGDDSAFHTLPTDTNTIGRLSSHLRSIVRKSRGSLSSTGSHETLKGSMIGSSSAGLLMVSESLDNCMLTQSLGPGTSTGSQNRKRHKSAGDHSQNKIRSNSLFANFRMRYFSEEDKIGMKFSDLIAKESNEDKKNFEVKKKSEEKIPVSEMQEISEEIKDSGVALDENEMSCTYDEDDHLQKECLSESDSKIVDKNEVSPCDTKPVSSELNNDLTSSETRNDDDKLSDTAVEMRRGDIGKNIRDLKSYSSPLHSMPTPVTENDPLGLFVEPSVKKIEERTKSMGSPNISPQKNREKFVASKPFADFDLGKNSVTDNGQGQCNTDDSSGNKVPSKGSHSSSVINSPVEKIQSTLYKMERTFSFPEDLGLGGKGQPYKTDRSSSVQTEQGALIHSSTSLNESLKNESKAEFRLFRTGSFRRHKDNFSGMLKFATGAVASKLSEIKLSMTPSKLGSKDSLTPSVDEIDSVNGEEEHYREARKRFGSADFLKRSTDTLDSSGHTRGSPVPESAPNRSYMSDYVGRGREEDSGSVHIKFSDLHMVFGDTAIEAEISSCSRCSRCRSLLYDEEIMAGWNADDSNLNTSCPFCKAKLVPHLMIYLKDHRGKRKSKVTDSDDDTDSIDEGRQHSQGDRSYGKDAKLCSSHSKDIQLLFGEEMDLDNNSVKSFDSAHDSHDPWTRQVPHTPKHNGEEKSSQPERRDSDTVTMSELALAGRHRRTASECLTSTTDIPYSSSVESFDNLSFRIKSPLNISLEERDLLPKQPSPQNLTSKNGILERGMCSMEPISVPYLSPIVLRKNLETIIESEGNNSLAVDTFVDEHPIIYWNLVYYFRRIETPSQLPGFLLTAKSLNKNLDGKEKQKYSGSVVVINPMWDNVKIHEEVGLPMHMAWNKGQSSTTVDALVTEAQPFNRAVMHQIITNIQCNDVLSPIKLVMNGRRRFRPRKSRFRSMYREILFLSFSACGRENIDHDAFDREYKLAFTRLSSGELKRLQRDDNPRSDVIMWCRKVFSELKI